MITLPLVISITSLISGVYRVALNDYYLVYAVRKFRGGANKQHKVIRTRQMKNFDKELFLADLASVDWQIDCLLKCTNDWYLDIDKGNFTSVTFIDLIKAFDTVNHEILLKKIYLCGIKDKELCWFRSYLSHRKQCCKTGGRISTFEDITCGVPQGSCLGPLFFLVYISDLHLFLNYSEVNMYADDTSISFSSDSIPEINKKVNYDHLCLKTWMESNKLSLNVAKTQTILTGGTKKLKNIENSETQNLQIVIDQEPVSKIKHCKYLGIVVDQFLNWEEHISALIKKISEGIGILRYGKGIFL